MTVETWTPAECAAFLKKSVAALAHHRSRGSGPPFIYVGRSVRYVPSEVGRWVRETQTTRARQQSNSTPGIVS